MEITVEQVRFVRGLIDRKFRSNRMFHFRSIYWSLIHRLRVETCDEEHTMMFIQRCSSWFQNNLPKIMEKIRDQNETFSESIAEETFMLLIFEAERIAAEKEISRLQNDLEWKLSQKG